jgi:protein SCO1
MMRWIIHIGLLASLPIAAHAATASVGGPFQLVDQDGRAVTERTYRGRPLLMYFGFTSCPDVCPIDMAKIASVARSVRAQTGIEVTPVFVTVDPERDTPERMKAYVRAFSPDAVGLTGSPAQIATVTEAYHVYFRKVPTEAGYLLDHSTVLYLIGPDGSFLAHYGRKLPEQEVVSRIAQTLQARR